MVVTPVGVTIWQSEIEMCSGHSWDCHNLKGDDFVYVLDMFVSLHHQYECMPKCEESHVLLKRNLSLDFLPVLT